MNFVCIVFELGDKILTLSSMENLIVQCNLQDHWTSNSGEYLNVFTVAAILVM